MIELSIEDVVGTLTPVFWWNLESKKPITVNSGGTSSSKTISILQVLALIASTQENKIITIVGQDLPNMKVGPIRDLANIVNNSAFLQSQIESYSKSTHKYIFKTKSEIEFRAPDSPQDAKSGKRTHLFINEANGVSWDIADELIVRTQEKVFIDFNPNARFWAHIQYENNENADWFISNYLHNPYLTQEQVNKILAYREKSPYKWRVYGLGLLGILEGHIIQNFEMWPEFPDDLSVAYGLDFGYGHPSALVKVAVEGSYVYLHLLLYESGIKDPVMAEWLKYYGITARDTIIGDAQQGISIDTINEYYGYNIERCAKGPGSIMRGIGIMQEYKYRIIVGSEQIFEEFSEYIWKNGKPPDKKNHAIDATRYVLSKVTIDSEAVPYEQQTEYL